jgi:hypothetical protein
LRDLFKLLKGVAFGGIFQDGIWNAFRLFLPRPNREKRQKEKAKGRIERENFFAAEKERGWPDGSPPFAERFPGPTD